MYSWAGPYVGVIGGYAWGLNNQFDVAPNDAVAAAAINYGDVASPLSANLSGAFVGGEAGYDYQFGAYVFGLKVDYAAAFIHSSGTSQAGGAPVVTLTNGAVTGIRPSTGADGVGSGQWATLNISNIGTFIGSLGYVVPGFNGAVELYAGGGLAWGDVSAQATAVTVGPGCAAPAHCFTGSGSYSGTGFGPAAEVGIKYKLTQQWEARVALKYANLGDHSFTVADPATAYGQGTVTAHTDMLAINFGIDYRF